jgi:adenylate cyclase
MTASEPVGQPAAELDLGELERSGLYDPGSADAADRLALLEYLAGLGFSPSAMSEANQQDRLAALSFDAVMRASPPSKTLRQVCEEAGLSLETALRVWTASGLPPTDVDEVRLGEQDVGLFAAFVEGGAVLGEEAAIDFTRVLGSAMARLADAAVSLFMVNLAAPLQGAGELALAIANYRAAESLRALPVVMDVLFLRHLDESIRRSELTREKGAYDVLPLAVGFVDLVGFTPLSRQRSTRELSELIGEFEARASDVTAAHDGRLVKLIGDEAMFVTVDFEGACDVALALVEAFGTERSEITPRGGVAYGDLLTRGGDYYGLTVNVSSRIAELAVPGEVLAPANVLELVNSGPESGLRFDPAGRRLLKGFEQPVELVAVRRWLGPE